MSTIQDFVAHIRTIGVAATNRYRITFGLPLALSESLIIRPDGSFADTTVRNGNFTQQKAKTTTDSSRSISLMCQAANVPGYNLQMTEAKYGAYNRKMPWSKAFGEFDTTFLSSGDMNERKLFDTWLELIISRNTSVEYYDNIIADIMIEVLDKANNVIYKIKAIEAYPSVVTSVALDRTATNATQTFQVTFTYWRLETNEDKMETMQGHEGSAGTNDGTGTVVSSTGRNVIKLPDLPPRVTGPAFDPNNPNDPNNPDNPLFPGAGGQGGPWGSSGPIFDSKRAVDIYKQIQNIKREMEKGLDAKSVGRILRQVSQEVRNVSGLPTSEADVLLQHINDLLWATKR